MRDVPRQPPLQTPSCRCGRFVDDDDDDDDEDEDEDDYDDDYCFYYYYCNCDGGSRGGSTKSAIAFLPKEPPSVPFSTFFFVFSFFFFNDVGRTFHSA